MNPFRSLRDYELFIYTLAQQFPSIQRSTLTVARRGLLYAELTGELTFVAGYRLSIYERLSWDWDTGALTIEGYSYEAWQGTALVYWYDSQPHPHDPTLDSTESHHKHVPPDIKHNRIPAPDLAFSAPNLPFLIREIEALLAG